MAGRPRGVEDAAILRAAADVIGRVGPVGLTLAVVAHEVGLVPGTLVQRFGSKRGLLLALAEQSAKHAAALPLRVRDEHESALGALAALIAESMASMATPQTFANHLAFLCIDLTDRNSASTPWPFTRSGARLSRHCSPKPCSQTSSALGRTLRPSPGPCRRSPRVRA